MLILELRSRLRGIAKSTSYGVFFSIALPLFYWFLPTLLGVAVYVAIGLSLLLLLAPIALVFEIATGRGRLEPGVRDWLKWLGALAWVTSIAAATYYAFFQNMDELGQWFDVLSAMGR